MMVEGAEERQLKGPIDVLAPYSLQDARRLFVSNHAPPCEVGTIWSASVPIRVQPGNRTWHTCPSRWSTCNRMRRHGPSYCGCRPLWRAVTTTAGAESTLAFVGTMLQLQELPSANAVASGHFRQSPRAAGFQAAARRASSR